MMDPLKPPAIGAREPWSRCGEYDIGAVYNNTAGTVEVIFHRTTPSGQRHQFRHATIPPAEYERAMVTLLMGLLIDVVPGPDWYPSASFDGRTT
jgi:hypothetical protein